MPHFDLIYASLMLLAVGSTTVLLRRTQRSLHLTSSEKVGLGIGAFCGAMVGAKLPFVLSDWEGLLSGASWLANGKTIVFGIVGGYFGVELAKWLMDVKVKTGDSFAIPVAIGVAIGRVGCFHAGCCYGRVTSLPWGVVFPTALDAPTAARHPTQLYESAFHLFMVAVLLCVQRRQLFPQQRLKLYLISYLAYRFVIEWLRPEPQILAGLTGYQWAALALMPVFAALWLRDAEYQRLGSGSVAFSGGTSDE